MRHAHHFEPFRALIALAFIGLAAAFLGSVATDDRNACMWDYDTLRHEAQGMPGTIEAITGRFDRFPPLYYEMRLERVTAEVLSEPTNLDLYDNAGVACDRLGRHDEAIAWMSRKREQLDRSPDAEHEYRYLANLGTFHAHRWLANGASREDLGDLDAAVDLIRRAIELNPDAHFGRERYQLLALKWLSGLPAEPESDMGWVPSLFDADPLIAGMGVRISYQGMLGEAGYNDAVEGLTGLITLGAAWESVDVLFALQLALMDRGDTSVAYLAWLRHTELRTERQRRSLHPDFAASIEDMLAPDVRLPDGSSGDVEAFFVEARAEADAWLATRNAYLTERLQAGEHPDTHPAFWGEWVEVSSRPRLPGSAFSRDGRLKLALFALIAGTVVIVWAGIRIARSIRGGDSTKAHA